MWPVVFPVTRYFELNLWRELGDSLIDFELSLKGFDFSNVYDSVEIPKNYWFGLKEANNQEQSKS